MKDFIVLGAGRDLDKMVAERVMGFWFEDDQWWTRHHDGGSRAYATAYLNIWGPNYASDGLPKFSTDIAAAWEVVEKLDEKKFFVQVQRLGDRRSDGDYHMRWGCAVWPTNLKAEAETAPLAICLAALKATETT